MLGTASVTVDTPGANPSTSTPFDVAITNPQPPTLTSQSPDAGPINSASSITLVRTGFGLNTVVEVNGQQVPTQYKTSTSLTATIPAAMSAHFGNVSVTVMTPPPYGGTSSALVYTVYLPISANDIVYNSADGLLYASVPLSSPEAEGNSVVGIDPNTGNVMRQIWVGSDYLCRVLLFFCRYAWGVYGAVACYLALMIHTFVAAWRPLVPYRVNLMWVMGEFKTMHWDAAHAFLYPPPLSWARMFVMALISFLVLSVAVRVTCRQDF